MNRSVCGVLRQCGVGMDRRDRNIFALSISDERKMYDACQRGLTKIKTAGVSKCQHLKIWWLVCSHP